MPPRIARSSVATAAPKTAKNKSKKRQLDAYSIASHSAPDKLRIRQHRLGESIDDEPRQKRRRLQDDDEDSEGEERIDSARRRQERNVTKRTGTGAPGGLDEEDVEYLSDSEGGEVRMGGLGSEDEDSDIDSDEAFPDSEEEKFSGFTFRGSKSGKGKPKKAKKVEKMGRSGDLDLDEQEGEDDESESDFGDEGVDLATMLDDDVDEQLGGKDKTQEDMDGESASDDEDDYDESDEQSESASEDEDEEEVDDEERTARLQDFVEALDAKPAKDKARIMGDEDGGLTVDDLLADADLDKATMATFRPKKKSNAPQTLKAPLPKRQQDRIDREVATEKAKEQLDRWRDTVIQNRRAEFLSFPLRNPDEVDPIGKDKLTSLQDDQPRTELEQSIQKIMEESGMATSKDQKSKPDDAEHDLLKAEELATNQMPVEEAIRRRAELRRNRALMFQEEIKAKRLAKIKSKSYRRVHRKQREREAEKERSAMMEAGLVPEMDEDEKELADRRRAEARMGAKHKDSKWARSLKATDRTVWDDSAREGAIEQARRQEELKKRVAGKDVGESGSEDDDDADDESDEDGAVMFRDLEKLKDADTPKKGIAGMAFMRKADERRRAENDEATEQLRREMAGEPSEEEEDEDEGLGRAIFGPAAQNSNEKAAPKQKRPELEEGDLSEDENDGASTAADPPAQTSNVRPKDKQPKSILKKSDKASGPLAEEVKDRRKPAQEQATKEASDPWLSGPSKSKKKSKADKQANAGANDDLITTAPPPKPADKLKPMTDKAKPKSKKAQAKAAAQNGTTQKPASQDANNDDASNSEPETTNPLLSARDAKKSLYSRAFAGDDVAQHFEDEKNALALAEDSKEISTFMPGWGTWTGAGLSKHAKAKETRARHNPLHKKKLAGVNRADRKDARLENVIVSEKGERKGKKYLAPVLPHGFERGEEYERSLRVPLGREWGTKEVVQRNVRPRVVTKPGAVIEAVERPMV